MADKIKLEDCIKPYTRCNPCDVCQLPIGKCPWLSKNKPVKGWDAKLVPYLVKNKIKGKIVKKWYKTWSIKSCPLYIEPPKERLMQMGYGVLVCPTCGKEYCPRAKNQMYCSPECKEDARKHPMKYITEYFKSLEDFRREKALYESEEW